MPAVEMPRQGLHIMQVPGKEAGGLHGGGGRPEMESSSEVGAQSWETGYQPLGPRGWGPRPDVHQGLHGLPLSGRPLRGWVRVGVMTTHLRGIWRMDLERAEFRVLSVVGINGRFLSLAVYK